VRGEGALRAVALAGLAGVVATLVVLLPATPAAACSCAEVGPVDEATLDDYDAALTGVVTGNEVVGDGLLRRELVVEVDEVFKGSAEATQLVVTHAQTSACGTDPAVGTEVLFLVHEGPSTAFPGLADAGELEVGACGGHRAASEAAALGAGRPPEGVADDEDAGTRTPGTGETTDPDPETGTVVAVAIGTLVAVVVVVGAGVVVLRRRRAGGSTSA
jgi:hypothetical protein